MRRNSHYLCLTCVMLIASAATAASGQDVQGEPFLSPDNILKTVIAGLPQEALSISGQLHVRKPRGIPVADYAFTMLLEWGHSPPRATYLIGSQNGTPLEQLVLLRPSDAPPQFTYFRGEDLDPDTVPPLAQQIQATDISWADLTLDFLWWPRCELIGDDETAGRKAFVLDVRAPADQPDPPYSRVRVWIDQQALFLLRAQGYDAADALTCELWVRSFKKIDDRWMIKDLEVQRYPGDHRTKLRVYDVQPMAQGDESDG